MKYGMIDPNCLSIVESLVKEKNGTLLDLGISSNRLYIEYRSGLCKNFIGMDLDKKVLRNIKNDRVYKKFNNFYCINSDAKNIPLRDNSIDVVTMLGLMGPLDKTSTYMIKLGLLTPRLEPVVSSQKIYEEYSKFMRRTLKKRIEKLIEDSRRVLKEDGILIISNREKTSPISSTKKLLKTHFDDIYLINGLERYLLICRKH